MAKGQVTVTKKKQQASRRMFALIFEKQAGSSDSTMHKFMTNINKDLDSAVFEDKKLASDMLIKVLQYIMPRESNGNQFNMQINNNAPGVNPESVVQTVDKFLAGRMKAISEVEERTAVKNNVRLREIGVVKEKDGKEKDGKESE